MSERILKLAKESGLKYYNWSTNESNIIDGEFKYPRLEDYKKFAELIVRECANKLRETDYELVFAEDGMYDPSISDAMLVAASDIEEHFGVE